MITKHYVRVGREVHIGYFIFNFKRPIWINRRVEWIAF